MSPCLDCSDFHTETLEVRTLGLNTIETTTASSSPPLPSSSSRSLPEWTMSRKSTPAEFLQSIVGRPVVIKLNSGVIYKGVLACLDGYMNCTLEQTEEYVDGLLKNKYGDAFIRGNNVLYISPATKRRK